MSVWRAGLIALLLTSPLTLPSARARTSPAPSALILCANGDTKTTRRRIGKKLRRWLPGLRVASADRPDCRRRSPRPGKYLAWFEARGGRVHLVVKPPRGPALRRLVPWVSRADRSLGRLTARRRLAQLSVILQGLMVEHLLGSLDGPLHADPAPHTKPATEPSPPTDPLPPAKSPSPPRASSPRAPRTASPPGRAEPSARLDAISTRQPASTTPRPASSSPPPPPPSTLPPESTPPRPATTPPLPASSSPRPPPSEPPATAPPRPPSRSSHRKVAQPHPRRTVDEPATAATIRRDGPGGDGGRGSPGDRFLRDLSLWARFGGRYRTAELWSMQVGGSLGWRSLFIGGGYQLPAAWDFKNHGVEVSGASIRAGWRPALWRSPRWWVRARLCGELEWLSFHRTDIADKTPSSHWDAGIGAGVSLAGRIGGSMELGASAGLIWFPYGHEVMIAYGPSTRFNELTLQLSLFAAFGAGG